MHSLHIPSDINYIINKMIKVPPNECSNIVKLTVQCMNEHRYDSINFKALSSKLSMSVQEVEDFFGMLLILIRWYQQLESHSDREIRNDLIEQGFSGEWTNNFLNTILNKEDGSCRHSNYMLQIKQLNWRIDISLYNSAFKRAMSPKIIWTISLSDGKQYTIEISLKKFHEIRFNISTILKEISIVKNNSLVSKK